MKKSRKRNKKSFKPKRYVLIVSEGEIERVYFQGLKVSEQFRAINAIELKVTNPKKNDAVGLVNEALRKCNETRKDRNPYQSAWVVLDRDNNQNLKQAFEKAYREKIQIAFSSIAFEYWFLLHFERIRKEFSTGSEVVDYLVRNHWPNYTKTKTDFFRILEQYLENALSFAPWLQRTG